MVAALISPTELIDNFIVGTKQTLNMRWSLQPIKNIQIRKLNTLMKLMTKEIEKRFAEVGSQEKSDDPIIIAKYFSPVGAATWLATEYYPETKLFFGYVSLFNEPGMNEFGYFSLDELESLTLPLGLKVERDLYCGEEKLSWHKAHYNIH